MQWFGNVKEKDIVAELEVGAANMSATEWIMEHLNMERANNMKGAE